MEQIYKLSKRLLDLVFSSIALLVLTPLMLPIMLILRLTAEGEVFYLQERIGFRDRKFGILKFATMLKNSPNIGTGTITLRNDPRVTPFGRFLRKSKLNELPQIVNVFRGEMSLVGPRPTVAKHYDAIPLHFREKIATVKPGITGVSAIVFRDEELWLSQTKMEPRAFYQKFLAPYKGQLEAWYVDNASFVKDLLILLLTIWTVIFSSSRVVFKVFKDLPRFEDVLASESNPSKMFTDN